MSIPPGESIHSLLYGSRDRFQGFYEAKIHILIDGKADFAVEEVIEHALNCYKCLLKGGSRRLLRPLKTVLWLLQQKLQHGNK